MNIGLFGGTFNPIHQGHIEVINHVKSAFSLDIVYIIPSAIPPHKTNKDLVPAKDRLEMVQQSFDKNSGFIVSDVELIRKGKSFSIDTIKYFKDKLDAQGIKNGLDNNQSRLFFIIGSDAFFDIDTWKKSREIFNLADIIVMIRAGDKRNTEDIEQFLQKVISPEYHISKECNSLIYSIIYQDNKSINFQTDNQACQTVYVCNVPKINISSTLIRDKIKKNESIKELVHPLVDSFIKEKQLYL